MIHSVNFDFPSLANIGISSGISHADNTVDLSFTPTNSTSVSISDQAKLLQATSDNNIFNPTNVEINGEFIDTTKLPVEKMTEAQFIPASDVSGIKQSIKNDFNNSGVYVDDSYIDAYYSAICDINTPNGLIPPGVNLPPPPDWWKGYDPATGSMR